MFPAPAALPEVSPTSRPRWMRWLWMAAGSLSLALGVIGIFLPLLPTTPFVLLAAACYSRGSARWEARLLAHPRWGPMVHAWRRHRVMPRRVKLLAWAMMAVGSGLAAWRLPAPAAFALLPAVPALVCLAVGLWMARLPEREPAPGPASDLGPSH